MRKRVIKKRRKKTTGASRALVFYAAAGILLVVSIASYFGYGRLVEHNEKGILCSRVYSRVLSKMEHMNNGKMFNEEMSLMIISNYEASLGMASKNDIQCVYYENIGDMMYNSYTEGYRDGKKAFLGQF